MKISSTTYAAAVFLLTVIPMSCVKSPESGPPPRASGGVLDLRNWDFNRDGPIKLDGEWEFYWEALLTPDHFSTKNLSARRTLINVPRSWNGLRVADKPVPGQGYATFRLVLLLKEHGNMLGLKINQVLFAYRVWAGGRLICSSGTVGTGSQDMVSRREVTITEFEPRSNTLELVIQVSNFHFNKGGIRDAVELGTAGDIRKRRDTGIAFDMFLFGSLIIMTLYHLGLFAFRRRDLYILYFGLFCLLFAMRALHMGEIPLTAFFPAIPWELMLRWEVLTLYLLAPAAIMLYRSLYPDEIPKTILAAILGSSALWVLSGAAASTLMLGRLQPVYLVFVSAVLCYIVFVLARASFRRRDSAMLFLGSFMLLFASGVNDILFAMNVIQTGQILHVGIFLFVFAQAFILSRRFARALSTVEIQRGELETANTSLEREIGDRQRAENALEVSREYLGRIINAIGDPIFVKNSSHRFVLVNDAECALAGRARQDMLGRTDYDFFPEKQVDVFWKTDEEILTTGTESINEEEITDASGKLRTILTKKTLYADAVGNRYIVGVVRDITDRKKTEKALKEYQDRLEELVAERTTELIQSNTRLQQEIAERTRAEQELLKTSKIESLGIFAGGIAHDFNNLLTAIMGNISLARSNMNAEDANYEILGEAEHASLKTRDLTHQLLTFSKGGAPIRKATSLQDLLHDTAEFVLRGSSIRCEYSIPADLWSAHVDAGQFSQVIHNLVLNARQAMPAGGTIGISARNEPLNTPRVSALVPGNYIRIIITDSGPGIPAEHIHKIFDPYYSTREFGNGLGLAISYSIVKNHGGYITVDSPPGSGASFTLLLPSSEEKAEELIHDAEESYAGRGRILVMDDEDFVCKVSSKMLESLGFAVVCVRDGSEAIDAYASAAGENRPFEAVIMDLTVPGGMGGRETMKNLRARFKDVRAIVSSGYSDDPIMADYESYGFMGVLVKPYRFEELKAAIRRILG